MKRASLALAAALLALGLAPARPVTDAEGFRLAMAPYTFGFPRDHASHPAFRSEWWYYTGHLRRPGRRYGFECTFFRVALPRSGPSRSAWRARDVVFLHAALTDETRGTFRCFDDARRAALGLASADSEHFDVRLGDAFARLAPDGRTHALSAATDGFGFALELTPRTAPVVHGHDGVSTKADGAGNASHYYSYPWMRAQGRVFEGADTLEVDGEAWFDHEFGSDAMGATHRGWDWFALQLDDGHALMAYRLRRLDGSLEPHSSGTWIAADGASRPLAAADVVVRATGRWRSPHTGGEYPSGWMLSVPSEGLDVTLVPTVRDQEVVASRMGDLAYWEGSVRVHGTRQGRSVAGEGYVELTGYAGRSPFAGGNPLDARAGLR